MSQIFVNIGFNNTVNSDKIIAIITMDSVPCKRLVQNRRESDNLIDCTGGRRTKSVIVMVDKQIILCALSVHTITLRLNGNKLESEEKE